MYTIIKVVNGEVEEFAVYSRISRSEVARYSTYAEALEDVLSR